MAYDAIAIAPRISERGLHARVMLQRSVENQGLAGDERVLDGQPRDQARDFLDASEPLQAAVFQVFAAQWLRQRPREAVFEDAGRDAIDAKSSRAQLLGHRPDHTREGRL